MNSATTTLAVTLVSPKSEKPQSGQVQIQTWDPKMRMRRALRALGICWGLALVTALIPLAHLILVPGFLIGGPFLANWIYRQQTMILGGTGTCPACGQPFQIVKGQLRWPLNDVCAKCHDAVVISPAE